MTTMSGAASASGPLEDRWGRRLGVFLPGVVARYLAVELVVWRAAIALVVRRRALQPCDEARGLFWFRYHEGATLRSFAIGLPFYFVVEAFLVAHLVPPHLQIVRTLHAVACVWFVAWLWGSYATFVARPHRIAEGSLFLHRGVWGHARVPLNVISAIESVPDDQIEDEMKRHPDAARLQVLGVPVVAITLNEPVVPMGWLRPARPTTKLFVSASVPELFRRTVGWLAPGVSRR